MSTKNMNIPVVDMSGKIPLILPFPPQIVLDSLDRPRPKSSVFRTIRTLCTYPHLVTYVTRFTTVTNSQFYSCFVWRVKPQYRSYVKKDKWLQATETCVIGGGGSVRIVPGTVPVTYRYRYKGSVNTDHVVYPIDSLDQRHCISNFSHSPLFPSDQSTKE